MFDYGRFLMTGFRDAVGKQPDYRVVENANGFYEKGVLTENDLSELQSMLEAKNKRDPETEGEANE